MEQQKQTNIELSEKELQEVTGGGLNLGPGPEVSFSLNGVPLIQNGHYTQAGIAWNNRVGQYNQKHQ